MRSHKLKRLLEYIHPTKVSKLYKDDLKSKRKAQTTQVKEKQKQKQRSRTSISQEKNKKHKTNKKIIPFIPIEATKIV